MAVLEWIGTGRGLALLDHRGVAPGELAGQIARIVSAHDRGLLFIAVVGGGPDVVEAMRRADSTARNRDSLGFYHLDEGGQLRRVAGRRLAELEKAGRVLPETAALSAEGVAAIMERGRRERLEAMEFVQNNTRRLPRVTVAYIALCFLFFALTVGDGERAHRLFSLLYNDGEAVRRGELWRLLTYALLHDPKGLTHLLVNMVSLYSLGGFLEPMLGARRVAWLYVLTALVGGVASTLFLDAISVGASGAVWGVLGATLGLLGGGRQRFPALVARGLRRNLIVMLVLNVGISFLPGIDRYAHFGGGLAGYLLARYFRGRSSSPTPLNAGQQDRS